MTPQEVETVMEVFRCCYLGGGCLHCPLNKDNIEGDCAIMSGNMVMDALNRLKFLETPTKVEQPELPGMDDIIGSEIDYLYDTHDQRAFRNFMTDEDIPISTRVNNALMRAGWKSIADFANTNLEEFAKVRNIGPNSFAYLAIKYNEARRMLGLEHVSVDPTEIISIYKEKRNWNFKFATFS